MYLVFTHEDVPLVELCTLYLLMRMYLWRSLCTWYLLRRMYLWWSFTEDNAVMFYHNSAWAVFQTSPFTLNFPFPPSLFNGSQICHMSSQKYMHLMHYLSLSEGLGVQSSFPATKVQNLCAGAQSKSTPALWETVP